MQYSWIQFLVNSPQFDRPRARTHTTSWFLQTDMRHPAGPAVTWLPRQRKKAPENPAPCVTWC